MSEIPEEFKKFSASFYSDPLDQARSFEEIVDDRIRRLARHRRVVVAGYLDDLLQKGNEAEMKLAWLTGGANFGPGDQQYHAFLTYIRTRVAATL